MTVVRIFDNYCFYLFIYLLKLPGPYLSGHAHWPVWWPGFYVRIYDILHFLNNNEQFAQICNVWWEKMRANLNTVLHFVHMLALTNFSSFCTQISECVSADEFSDWRAL